MKNKKLIGFYKTPTGSYFLPEDAPNDIVIKAIKNGEIFEKEIVKKAIKMIKPGTTVLDIGANFGQMGLLFASKVGPSGLVYSFEANPFIFDLLNKNIAANKVKNIITISDPVYNTVGSTIFFPEPDLKRFGSYGSYGIDPNGKTGYKLKTMTIDSLNIITPISLMKIDIQGSDLFALEGARETIRKNRMPIIFEYEEQFQKEFKTSFDDYLNFIDSIDYFIDKKIYGLNYLILAKEKKSFSFSRISKWFWN